MQDPSGYLSLNLSNHLVQNFNLDPGRGENIDCPKSTDLFPLDLLVILFVIVANVAAAATPRENLDIKSLLFSLPP